MQVFSKIAVSLLCVAGLGACSFVPGADGPGGRTAYVSQAHMDVRHRDASSVDPAKGLCFDYLSARFAAAHHDAATASALYRRCLERDPSDVELLTSAYFYASIAGDATHSAKLAKRLVKAAPGQNMAHLTLAVAAMAHKDYTRARDEISASDQSLLSAVSVRLFEVWADAGRGDRAAAEKIIRGLYAQKGAEVTARFNEALLAEYFDDAAATSAAYDKLTGEVALSPRLVEAYGRFLERNGREAEARALYLRVGTRSAFGPVARSGLARIDRHEKPDALVRTPADGAAEALFGVASVLDDPANADISLLFLRLVKQLRPDFTLADLLMADRYEQIGHFDAAIAIYAAIPEASPYYRLATIQNASDRLMQGRPEEAEKVIRDLAEIYPNDAGVWTVYGDVYRELKKFDSAVAAYGKAIALSGKRAKQNWVLYFSRANAAQEDGNWPAAEADLQEALRLNPNQPQILNFLGYSWVDQHQNLNKAMAMLEKASRLAPDNGYITDSVGWAYYRLGHYRAAAEKLEEAVLLVPEDPTINDHLGDAYWMTGRKLEAKFQWNHALAFGAADEEKALIRQKLARGLTDVSGGK